MKNSSDTVGIGTGDLPACRPLHQPAGPLRAASIETGQRSYLYLTQANLIIYLERAHYSGIEIFNKLPLEIKKAAGKQKKFKIGLKQFLHNYSFYTLEEYFNKS